MKGSIVVGFAILFTLMVVRSAAAQSEVAPGGPGESAGVLALASAPPATIDQAIDQIIKREQIEVAEIRRQTPIVQTYIQEVKLDKDSGTIPQRDHYFLGQARLNNKSVEDNSMLSTYDGMPMKGALAITFRADAFLQMIYVDPHPEKFTRQNYKFDYVGREFLGEVRCVVFDVTPLPKTGNGRFRGRIYAEDQDYTIVRFSGAYTPIDPGFISLKFNTHFDSWRANVQPGIWLPSYIYLQEMNMKLTLGHHERFKAITNLWGYKLSASHKEAEFASMTIETPAGLEDKSEVRDNSAVESKREWNSEAEQNAAEALERAGILTPAGSVDKILDTVVNNLEVTNGLDIDLHCRVATFTTFELFSVGKMIVVSRGLLDVIPDEATLASILAQGIADAMNPNPLVDQYAFGDFARVQPLEALRRYSFKEKPEDIKAANEKVLEYLMNSPYKNKLDTASLFLIQLNSEAKALSALISPRLGNSVYLGSQLGKTSSVSLDAKKLDQIAALPIGGRIKMNVWDDSIEFMKSKPVPLFSSREKMPFSVTPIQPYMSRYKEPVQNARAEASSSTDDAQPPRPSDP